MFRKNFGALAALVLFGLVSQAAVAGNFDGSWTSTFGSGWKIKIDVKDHKFTGQLLGCARNAAPLAISGSVSDKGEIDEYVGGPGSSMARRHLAGTLPQLIVDGGGYCGPAYFQLRHN